MFSTTWFKLSFKGNILFKVEELSEFMLKHTDYSDEEVANKIVGEWYVRKDEAIQKGVVHEIIDDISMLF